TAAARAVQTLEIVLSKELSGIRNLVKIPGRLGGVKLTNHDAACLALRSNAWIKKAITGRFITSCDGTDRTFRIGLLVIQNRKQAAPLESQRARNQLDHSAPRP